MQNIRPMQTLTRNASIDASGDETKQRIDVVPL